MSADLNPDVHESVDTQTGEIMSNLPAVATPAPTQLVEWTPERTNLLKRTLCREATDDEFLLFLMQCKRTKLDPFARQIYMVKRWDSKLKMQVATIQTGIDGFRVIAARTGDYAGSDEPLYVYRETGDRQPFSATVTVWRMVQGLRVAFTATAHWDEYAEYTKEGNLKAFWAGKPRLMLGKCAEALALRKGFPQELSGLYTDDEMPHLDGSEGDAPGNGNGTDTLAGRPTPSQAAPKPRSPEVRTFQSKYGSAERPNKCCFCLGNHIKQGDEIMYGPSGSQWAGKVGAKYCYDRCLNLQEPEPVQYPEDVPIDEYGDVPPPPEM